MKQHGGKLEGKGGHGIIYSNPRLPYLNEKNYDPNNKECSKIFYKKIKLNNKYIETEDIDGYDKERIKYKNLNEMNIPLNPKYFILPLRSGDIDIQYVKNKSDIFNDRWSEKENLFKKATKQITFELGTNIKKDDIHIFYKNFKNIINAVQFMNNNKLLFDDLKLGNIVNIHNTYKIIDFSSIIEFNKITTNLNKSFIKHYDYYIYSHLLNILLTYFIEKKLKKIDTSIIKNIYNNKKLHNSYHYKKLIFDNIKKYNNISIEIPLVKIEINNNNIITKNVKLKINIHTIIDQILIKSDNSIYYTNIIIYYKFLNEKFKMEKNPIIHILYYLQKKININCLGTIIVEYFKNKKINEDILLFISLCCLPFYYDKTGFYVNDIDIEGLLKKY